MNYDELVKELRFCAATESDCSKCRRFESIMCEVSLHTEAADAIEELQAEYNELLFRCGQAEALIDFYQQMPKEDEA